MVRGEIRKLAPGKVFYEYGPISMTLAAWHKGIPMTELCSKGCGIAAEQLHEIGKQLGKIKIRWPECEASSLQGITSQMLEAVKRTGDEGLTPLASVAGAIADSTADWLFRQGATRVIVNNGGDIALRLGEGEEAKVGVMSGIVSAGISETICLTSEDRVGGIASSGMGGRSLTCGIAECVTVLAENCAIADACATSLANASFLHSPEVKQVLAHTLDPNTDIPNLMVTVDVGTLTSEELQISMKKVEEKAREFHENNIILGMLAYIQGRSILYPPDFIHQILVAFNNKANTLVRE